MRIIALLCVRNERRFVANCIEHLRAQNVDVYVLDHESEDGTLDIAQRYLHHGVIGCEVLPFTGIFDGEQIFARKEALARELPADWFLHVDADEIKVAGDGRRTLRDAVQEVDSEGFNAINFLEYTFIPTREQPDHDREDYRATMRHYYPFSPQYPHRVNLWKAQPADVPVDMASSHGHRITFPGLKLYPRPFILKHYLCLSLTHLREKYLTRVAPLAEIRKGWWTWRISLDVERLEFPPQSALREFTSDAQLDASAPWKEHWFEQYRLMRVEQSSR